MKRVLRCRLGRYLPAAQASPLPYQVRTTCTGSGSHSNAAAGCLTAISMARVCRASVDLQCIDVHRGGPSALHLLAGFLARPELALVVGAVLRVGFDRVWGILLEER